MNLLWKRSDLPFLRKSDHKKEKSVNSFTHGQNIICSQTLRACLHGVGDPGLVGLVSFVFTLWGTQNKRNLLH